MRDVAAEAAEMAGEAAHAVSEVAAEAEEKSRWLVRKEGWQGTKEGWRWKAGDRKLVTEGWRGRLVAGGLRWYEWLCYRRRRTR
mgnify:CR=1 FL=1